jgi:hypothetical protein
LSLRVSIYTPDRQRIDVTGLVPSDGAPTH